MSHRRQQVPSWLPRRHAARSLAHLHNSLRPLLSHTPMFCAQWYTGCSLRLFENFFLLRLNGAFHSSAFPRANEDWDVKSDTRGKKKHIHEQNRWVQTANESNEAKVLKKKKDQCYAASAKKKLSPRNHMVFIPTATDNDGCWRTLETRGPALCLLMNQALQ